MSPCPWMENWIWSPARAQRFPPPADKMRVDNLRADVDAVMVGGRTLLQENPRLTVKSERTAPGQRNSWANQRIPSRWESFHRIGEGDLPAQCDFLSAGPAGVMLFTTTQTHPETIRRLEACGAQVHIMGDKRVDLLAGAGKPFSGWHPAPCWWRAAAPCWRSYSGWMWSMN